MRLCRHTLADDHSKAFVFNGGVPLLFTILLMITLHFGVILREESYLEAKFGERYLAFKREVRRWI